VRCLAALRYASGTIPADIFYSGTFEAGGYRIGFIRIPSFAPANVNNALTTFQREIDFFKANTDGLIVDVTRNPAGAHPTSIRF
jgi:C-terminal processing protease CtpA/Prc